MNIGDTTLNSWQGYAHMDRGLLWRTYWRKPL